MPAEQGNWSNGTVVSGRYTIASLLGKGGMGEVYRAWDGNLGTDVVIKAPLPEVLGNKEFVQRFDLEIRSLVRLAHPHIVRVTDCGNHNGLPFAVMQFLPGGSLKDRQQGSNGEMGPAPAEDLEAWLPQVASALDFIHTQGYIHRDVKPANILFDAHGNAYLSDFGIAKVHAENAGVTKGLSLTAQNMVLGTPEYMAPELIMGHNVDGRIDQYALAVTAYEALCGRPPFSGQPTAILVMHTGQQPPPPSFFFAGISPAIEEVVLRGMSKSPDQRFPDCASFAKGAIAAARSPAVGTAALGRGSTVPVMPVGGGRMTAQQPASGILAASGAPTQSWSEAATPAGGMAIVGNVATPAAGVPVVPAPASRPVDRRTLLWIGGSAACVLGIAGLFFAGVAIGGRGADSSELSDDEKAAAIPLAARDEGSGFTNSLGMTMVAVRPGRFAGGAYSESKPSWATVSTPFWISAHEVTVAQYLLFLESAAEKSRDARHPEWLRAQLKSRAFPQEYEQMGDAFRLNASPVVGIREEDAVAFCEWLTTQDAKLGMKYRLPTRDEWLCAARAGTTTKFAWGDNLAGGKFNGPGAEDGESTLAPVGRFPANPWGLFDMTGNVRELVVNPSGLAGGGWDDGAPEIFAAGAFEGPSGPHKAVGFRVVAVPAR